MKKIGTWWNDRDIDLVEIEGEIFRLAGWNGEEFTNCWKCLNEFDADPDNRSYNIRLIYDEKENENGGFDIIDYQIL